MPERPHILLTNDDSHDSPLFLFAIAALSAFGDVSIVVPAEEQSWKGKSMTRYGPVYAHRIEIHGMPAWSVTGTPADCVNLGIYNLLERAPDVVVSGINIGRNAGLGFMLASGTIGACLEANIAGLPALALSQELPLADFRHWDRERSFESTTVAALESLCIELVPRIWHDLIACGDGSPITWNVNFPFHCAPDLALVRTRLGHSFYHGCFRQRGDQYHHALTSVTTDPRADSDDVVLAAGHVTITRLDIRSFGQEL